MKAVIMVGGLGTRLRPYTQVIPKPLLPIGEQCSLDINLKKLKEGNVDEVILAVNYKSELFESYCGDGSKYGLSISYSKEQEPLGTSGPLSLIKDHLHEDFLVINGDVITDLKFSELMKFHKDHDADITIVTKDFNFPLAYGVIKTQGDQVVHLEEKSNIKAEIVAGIYAINPRILKNLPKGHSLMTDFIRDHISGKRVLHYKLEGYWLDIGQTKDYEQAQADAAKGVFDR